jgi:lipopolysaccharide biosynthesis protein
MSNHSEHIKPIAFYLPQYHPIPENDKWWGKGFTEWTNVRKAMPKFPGHYQPHVPGGLGYYDLRDPNIRSAQADLAREHGIYGFCYYHYWFNGRRVLERPFTDVLSSGEPDFPFCLCWANENWTRTWDGGADDILLQQNYSDEDDQTHIRSLLPALADSRYIRVNGKPLILIYRTELLPEPKRTADVWRSAAIRAGVGDLYLARVESFVSGVDPLSIGFDAAVEFSPDWRNLGEATHRGLFRRLQMHLGLKSRAYFDHRIYDYTSLVEVMLNKRLPSYQFFRCVCPSFDNSPRRNHNSVVLHNSSPECFYRWIKDVVEWTSSNQPSEKRVVFINAWNEWGEGNHLEPDQRWGRAYLEMTAKAVCGEISR